jgi:polygalacturonase
MINCTYVAWRDFRVLRSPFWATQIIASRYVLVDRVRIHVNDSNYCPPSGGPCVQPTNEDGLDIAACQHVVVRDSEIYSHDDSIALLAGSGWWPEKARQDLFNVTIVNNSFTSEQAAIALDTAWGAPFGPIPEPFLIHGSIKLQHL